MIFPFVPEHLRIDAMRKEICKSVARGSAKNIVPSAFKFQLNSEEVARVEILIARAVNRAVGEYLRSGNGNGVNINFRVRGEQVIGSAYLRANDEWSSIFVHLQCRRLKP
jgi:hypothetical protein